MFDEMRRFTRTVLVLAGCLGTTVVEAQERRSTGDGSSDVTRLNEEGAALYEQRDYRRAIERFIEAYAIDRNPNLLFNIARCYEKLGETDAAIEKYERFLILPGADAQGRERAEASLEALRALARVGRKATPGASEPSSAIATPPSAASDVPEDERREPLSRTWPWVTLVAGGFVTGTGLSLYLLGERDHDAVRESAGYGDSRQVYGLTEREARDLVASGDAKKTWGVVALGGGGALLVTSAVLFWLSGKEGREHDEPISVAVWSEEEAALMTLFGRF